MEAVCITDEYGIAIGTKNNPIHIVEDGDESGDGADNFLTLTYNGGVDPVNFVDISPYKMVAVHIPPAANGLTASVLVAESNTGSSRSIPKFIDTTGSLVSFYSFSVYSGDKITIQAEIAPYPFFGLRFSSGITGIVKVWPKN